MDPASNVGVAMQAERKLEVEQIWIRINKSIVTKQNHAGTSE
jgi:hypothetical protein